MGLCPQLFPPTTLLLSLLHFLHGQSLALRLAIDPAILLPRPSHRSPRFPPQPWTPTTFPFIGSHSCASDYHSRPARDFLCDPDQMLGHASASLFTERLESWWDFCTARPRRKDKWESTTGEISLSDWTERRWKLGMGVARVLAVAPRASDCLPIPPNWQYPFVAALNPRLSIPILLDTAHHIRQRWSDHADCRIDALILLAQKTWLCNGTWRHGGLSLSLALSPPLALYLNSSSHHPAFTRRVWRARPDSNSDRHEWQLVSLAIQALEEFQDAQRNATRYHKNGKSGPIHSVPLWAWALFAGSTGLSLSCAYCGHSINSTGRLAFLIRSQSAHRRGGWGAGFGGGMLEMRSGGAGGAAPAGPRRGLMGGMMSKPRKSMNEGGGRF